MAVTPFKTFVPGEILTASDLNNSFLQVFNNGEDLGYPATKSHDMNGFALVMDGDGDSNIRSSVNNRLDITLGGVSLFRFDGTAASSVNGIDFISGASGTPASIVATGTATGINVDVNPTQNNVLWVRAFS